MAKSFEFKGVPTPDAEFYRYYWGLPVPPEIVEIIVKWRRPAGTKLEEAYAPYEIFRHGWRDVLIAFYNLGFAVNQMETEGKDLTSEDMLSMCQVFGVPAPVWKTVWILQNESAMIAKEATPDATG